MLKRNLNVKLAPQRWQDNAGDGVFDVVMTFEEKVFDSVLEGNQDSSSQSVLERQLIYSCSSCFSYLNKVEMLWLFT